MNVNKINFTEQDIINTILLHGNCCHNSTINTYLHNNASLLACIVCYDMIDQLVEDKKIKCKDGSYSVIGVR